VRTFCQGISTEVWSCTAAWIGTGFVYAVLSRRPFRLYSGCGWNLVKLDSDFSYRPIREFLGSRWSRTGKFVAPSTLFLTCSRRFIVFFPAVISRIGKLVTGGANIIGITFCKARSHGCDTCYNVLWLWRSKLRYFHPQRLQTVPHSSSVLQLRRMAWVFGHWMAFYLMRVRHPFLQPQKESSS